MGLKTIVRDALKRRGLTWDRKAPQAQPNKKAAARLAARQRGHQSILDSNKNIPAGAFRMPGGYK